MIIRNHYMAQLKGSLGGNDDEDTEINVKTENSAKAQCSTVTEGSAKIEDIVSECQKNAQKLIDEGKLLTAALYHYRNMLFLYYEEVDVEIKPDAFMGAFEGMIEKWPQDGGMVSWMKMFHIYYHNEPKSVEQWQKDRHPEHRRGRIAKLCEDKLFEYVYHHVSIVKEGLLTGDKYQSIALYGDMLFSYFEEPKKFVNIKEDYEHESKAINDWLAVDPESHFIPFPEAGGSNFYIIPEYFAIGR